MTSSVLAENLENRQCSFGRWGLPETHSSNLARVCRVTALVWSKWKAGGSGTVGPALNLSVHFITPLFSSVAIDSSGAHRCSWYEKRRKKKLDACRWHWKANGTAFYLFAQHLLANSPIVPRISDLWKKTCRLRVGERLLKRMLRWRRTRKSLKCTKSTGLIAFVQAIGFFLMA